MVVWVVSAIGLQYLPQSVKLLASGDAKVELGASECDGTVDTSHSRKQLGPLCWATEHANHLAASGRNFKSDVVKTILEWSVRFEAVLVSAESTVQVNPVSVGSLFGVCVLPAQTGTTTFSRLILTSHTFQE